MMNFLLSSSFSFKPINFIKNLGNMGIGMLGIFIVVAILIGATYLLNRFLSKSGKDD